MKVFLMSLEDGNPIMILEDVIDVSQGICGMTLIEMKKRNVLINVTESQYLEIEKEVE